jgi:spectinomycin phosphotransferase
MRAGESRFLIDWDTVAMALPERDLWMLDDGRPDAFDAYVDATGRSVDQDAIALYGIAWHLTDIALFVELLRGSHVDDGDTRKVLADLPVAKARLAPYMPK